MPRYLYSAYTGDNDPGVKWFKVAASQTIKNGDLVEVNATSKLLEVAAAASTTIVGIAGADYTTGATVTANDRIPVTLVRHAVIQMPYTGTTKTTLADTDLFVTKFDLSNQTTINLDDTTGGMCQVVDYDNNKKTANVVINVTNIAY